MNVISLEEEAFHRLINTVLEEVEQKFGQKEPEWIPEKEALVLLNVKSKTTLQQLRDTDQIKFSQPRKKIILYNKKSILEFLEAHANK